MSKPNGTTQPKEGLRITMVLPSLDVGGMERMTADLAEALIRLGHEVSILCTDRLGELAAGTPVHALQGRSTALGLVSHLGHTRPDVVHLHMAPWLKASLAARFVGARFLNTLHGVTEGRAIRSMGFAAGLTHDVVLVSESLRGFAVDTLGVRNDKVSVIPNGIDVDRFSPIHAPRPLRAELGISSSAHIVGTVARMSPVKNLQLLVRSMVDLVDIDAHLVLVGDGETRVELQELVEALGLLGRVHFLGSLVDTVPTYLAFDVFALSSLSEGMPMCLLEALACQIPIVSTDVGGVAQLLDGGRLGKLVPTGNQEELSRVLSATLLADVEESKGVAKKGRKICEDKFSTSAMAKHYERLYYGRRPSQISYEGS